MVKSSRFGRPVPLRIFGDGLNRVFEIALAMANAKGGLLLIDEIENGLHYSTQVEVWKIIFQMARALNVQIFATTHSWEAIEAFQEAISAADVRGTLIRLSHFKETIVPTIFDESELAIVTRDQIEVR